MCVCSSPAERAYEISHSGPATGPEERENSIFVAALKEHVQKGTLDTRIDILLTEAAKGSNKCTVSNKQYQTDIFLQVCVSAE